jgi:hypothetical protein
MVKNRSTLWYAALLVGWAFDFLYWKKTAGIAYFIHILLILGVLTWVVLKERIKPAFSSYYLVPLILIFSLLTFIRMEPFTRTLNYLLSLGLLGLLLLTLQGGRWFVYTLSDYIISGLRLMLNMIGLPFKLIMAQDEELPEGKEKESDQQGWKRIAPYLRGILIALPVITVLAALLGEADPIFSTWLEDLIELLRLEKLPEYILRLVLIGFWTMLAAGGLLYALVKSQEEKLVGTDQPWPPRFLGSTETIIVMGAINILYFSFVTIQFRYFFGGEKNINLDGYTYAEYARRGFGELLVVAFFTLFIIMVLSSITKRESKGSRTTFSVLTGAMTAFIGVILISSLQRLTLYEAAYGFSRLRTYSHLCILWIGALFLAILILEITQKHRYFTLASLAAVAGFVLTMNLVNVDALITRRNIQRLEVEEAALDTYFLHTLSLDAIPVLIEKWDDPALSNLEKEEIAAILACRVFTLEEQDQKWQSFTLPTYRAQKALSENSDIWEDVELLDDQYRNTYTEVGEKQFYCYSRVWMD